MTTNDTWLSTEQNETAKVVAPATQAQRDLLDTLRHHLVKKCRAKVARLVGEDRNCVMQVIGVHGVGDQPWVPGLLMSHALPKSGGSADSSERANEASIWRQWAFRMELPQVTSTKGLSAALDGLAPRLAGIRETLCFLNSRYGWVDNHAKADSISEVFHTETLKLVDPTGLEFILCPDSDETLNHVRMQACEVSITTPMEAWVMEWAGNGGGISEEDLPPADSDFLATLRTCDGCAEQWEDNYGTEAFPSITTVNGEEVLELELALTTDIPYFEPTYTRITSAPWVIMGEIHANREVLGMSARTFQKLVGQDRNPFVNPYDETDLEAEDLEILQIYRAHIDADGTFEDAHEAYQGRAATKADWARDVLKRHGWYDDIPRLLRRLCVNWRGVAKQVLAVDDMQFFEQGGYVWAFAEP